MHDGIIRTNWRVCRSDFQHIFYGVDTAVGLEGEILVIKHHLFLTLFTAVAFDVGEHADRDKHNASVG